MNKRLATIMLAGLADALLAAVRLEINHDDEKAK